MLSVLAQAATVEAIQSLDDRVSALDSRAVMLIRLIVFVVIVAGLMFGWSVVGKWVASNWAKLKSDLRLPPRREAFALESDQSRFPTTAALISAAQGTAARALQKSPSDSAAQSLLQQIAADSTVLSAEMKVEKSNGTLELKFTAKGAASNG